MAMRLPLRPLPLFLVATALLLATQASARRHPPLVSKKVLDKVDLKRDVHSHTYCFVAGAHHR